VEHAVEMVGALADPSLYVVTGGTPPTFDELTARYGRQVVGQSDDGSETWHNWVIRNRATGEAAGFIQSTVTHEGGRVIAELAWVVGVPWQGRGLATEGAEAAMKAVTDDGADEVRAHIAPGHVASEIVAARLGLRRTEVMHDGETRWSSLD
jgi:RimJ/RimL family protein N-acetyltransferase